MEEYRHRDIFGWGALKKGADDLVVEAVRQTCSQLPDDPAAAAMLHRLTVSLDSLEALPQADAAALLEDWILDSSVSKAVGMKREEMSCNLLQQECIGESEIRKRFRATFEMLVAQASDAQQPPKSKKHKL